MTDIACPKPPCHACPWRSECPTGRSVTFVGDFIPWARLVGDTQAQLDAYRRAGERRPRRGRA